MHKFWVSSLGLQFQVSNLCLGVFDEVSRSRIFNKVSVSKVALSTTWLACKRKIENAFQLQEVIKWTYRVFHNCWNKAAASKTFIDDLIHFSLSRLS